MRKNKIMRFASLILVLTLLSTSVISGTFAKYTTTDSANDSARVAKWGVELQVEGNLFGDTYKDTIVADTDTTMTVQSVDKAADVVAPGTKNEDGFTFSLKGQPEVDGQIITTIKTKNIFLNAGTYGVMIPVAADVVTSVNFDEMKDLYTEASGVYTKATSYTDGATYYTLEDEVTLAATYYPLVFSATGNTSYTGTANPNDDSLKLLIYAIDNKLGTISPVVTSGVKTYSYPAKGFESNTNLATEFLLDNLKITWEWPISTNNGADTILGMLTNTTNGVVVKGTDAGYTSTLTENTDYCLDVMFDMSVTVEQVD